VGFYDIGGATYLCLANVMNEKETEITKIEGIDEIFYASDYKNQNRTNNRIEQSR
jgi:hypothetical protein